MTIVSYSEVLKWITCRREYYYRCSLGLRPIEESNTVTKGVDGHHMLKVFYRGLQQGMSKEEARNHVLESLPKQRYQELIDIWVLVENYILELDTNGVAVIVERPMIVEPSPDVDLKIGFTVDLMWQVLRTGRIQLEDSKFIVRKWSQKKVNRYVQLPLYYKFLSMLGYSIDSMALRFFNRETKQNYQQIIPFNTPKIEATYAEFMAFAVELQQFKELTVAEQREVALRTLNNNICQYCKYELPCTLELEGRDASKTLASQYTPDTSYGYDKIGKK